MTDNLGHYLSRVRREARTLAGRSPALCRLFRTGEFPTAETEVCIEGVPRSGNTYAVIAFQVAQGRTVSIAHHVHAAGAVIAAARMGTPVLVLVRKPEEAVLSYLVRWPHLTMGHALRVYVHFYAPLLPYRTRFVVGRFEDVVHDFGKVTRDLNQRFGTSFEEFVPTDANLAAVMEELDQWDVNTFGRGDQLELGRGRPTEAKDRMKAASRPSYRTPRLARLRARAEQLYETLAGDIRQQ
jgi:hypothetical protein